MKGRQTWFHFTAVVIFALCSGGFFFWHFLDRPAAQPIAFSHQQHVEKQIACTFCHQSTEQSATAGIPSAQLCMVCHQSIKTDSQEVKKLQVYFEKKQEVPWVRVYGFPSHAHVYFNHQRHIAAGVDCAKCHGEVGQMTVAQPVVKQTMGWCVQCHKDNRAKFKVPKLATDCLTCHY